MEEFMQLLKGGGRKFAVGLSALRYGFMLSCLALGVIAVVPTSGIHVAEVMGAFGLMVSVIVGSYQVSNALGDKWNPTVRPIGSDPSPSQPAPRQSGTVAEPGGS